MFRLAQQFYGWKSIVDCRIHNLCCCTFDKFSFRERGTWAKNNCRFKCAVQKLWFRCETVLQMRFDWIQKHNCIVARILNRNTIFFNSSWFYGIIIECSATKCHIMIVQVDFVEQRVRGGNRESERVLSLTQMYLSLLNTF